MCMLYAKIAILFTVYFGVVIDMTSVAALRTDDFLGKVEIYIPNMKENEIIDNVCLSESVCVRVR